MNRFSLNNHRGFTLIETMIALVLLAFGILAIMNMSLASVQGNFSANNVTNISNLADEVFEMIRANADNIQVYDGITTDDGPLHGTRPDDVADPIAANDYDLIEARLGGLNLQSPNCAITILNDIPGVGLNTAQVVISWTSVGDHLMTFAREFSELR